MGNTDISLFLRGKFEIRLIFYQISEILFYESLNKNNIKRKMRIFEIIYSYISIPGCFCKAQNKLMFLTQSKQISTTYRNCIRKTNSKLEKAVLFMSCQISKNNTYFLFLGYA